MWWKKLKSDEYEDLLKKFLAVNAKIEKVEMELGILNTNYDNLRGNFNRKLSGIKPDKPEKEESEKNKNSQVFLDPNGNIL